MIPENLRPYSFIGDPSKTNEDPYAFHLTHDEWRRGGAGPQLQRQIEQLGATYRETSTLRGWEQRDQRIREAIGDNGGVLVEFDELNLKTGLITIFHSYGFPNRGVINLQPLRPKRNRYLPRL